MKRENILLTFLIGDDPNKTELSILHFNNDNSIDFKAASGFAANDIYNLLVKGEENESCTDC